MKHNLHNLKNAAEHIRLSESEKSAMRTHIYEVMQASRKYAEPKKSPYFFFAYSRMAVSFAFVMLVLLGGTTTYAAQGSLPGGALYPVKIYVNENIQEALAVSDEAKVSFHTSVAEERLKEAEALASEGKLNAVAVAKIEENFNEHVAKADTIAANLEEKDVAAGVGARVALESSIAVHSSILVNIGDNSEDEATKENSNSIAMKAQSRNRGGIVAVALKATAPVATSMQTMGFAVEGTASNTVSDAANTPADTRMMAKTNATATIPAATTSSQKRVAVDLQKKATVLFAGTKESYDNARTSLSASTTAKVKAQLASLEKKMSEGKKQMKAEKYEAARATFTEVIQISIELGAFIDASKLYKRDFIGSLWGEVRGWTSSRDDTDNRDDEQRKGEGKDSPNGDTSVSNTTTIQIQIDPASTPGREVPQGSTTIDLKGGLHIDLGL